MSKPHFTYESPDGKARPISSIGYAVYIAQRDYRDLEEKGIIRCDEFENFRYVITKDSKGGEVDKNFDEEWYVRL